jgi:acyl phosphate:glycerol-3-phosphate acyltransferase
MLHPTHWSLGLPGDAAMFSALALGYLFGSIPFGLIVTRLAGTTDIRRIGSGNIGATNVLRTGRKELAAATLIGDMLKGSAAVLLASALWGKDGALVAGLGAFLGHLFPLWLRFRGGKGVATYLGIVLGLAPWPGAVAFAVTWIAVATLSGYSSLAALLASVVTPAVLWVENDHQTAALITVLTILIFIRHRANIARLMAGTEGKIRARNGASSNS